MRSRVVFAGLALSATVGLVACGSSGGTGAPPVTTIKLGAASFVTETPIIESTVPASTVPGANGPVLVATPQTYTVKANDALYNIAKHYCISAQQIADYNQWESTAHPFNPGDVIQIPPGACDPSTVTQATTVTGNTVGANAPVTPSVTTTTLPPGPTYVVVAGDYLGGIAKKTGTTVQAIVAANGWSDGSKHNINPGDKIRLPAKTG
ncbi:MAG TPA: LysM peptidoglycan-binding domain-containing protein [Ilumatobacteraceae bacterium]